MKEGKAKGSELVIYEDGTLYHINLKRADNIPTNILLVGAAERADAIATHFDTTTLKSRNPSRPEFYLVAGTYKNVPVATLSIGIGSDNTEIAINELHALFEYDHKKDAWEKPKRIPVIIRVGTAGSSLPDIPPGTIAISEFGLGLDNLGAYYPAPANRLASKIESKFLETKIGKVNTLSYCSSASPEIISALKKTAAAKEKKIISGITTSSPGFFAPEGRKIGRMQTSFSMTDFLNVIRDFSVDDQRIVNHEMEAAALFRLSHELLGYRTGNICLVVDNLVSDEFIDKKTAESRMHECIEIALGAVVEINQA